RQRSLPQTRQGWAAASVPAELRRWRWRSRLTGSAAWPGRRAAPPAPRCVRSACSAAGSRPSDRRLVRLEDAVVAEVGEQRVDARARREVRAAAPAGRDDDVLDVGGVDREHEPAQPVELLEADVLHLHVATDVAEQVEDAAGADGALLDVLERRDDQRALVLGPGDVAGGEGVTVAREG